MGVAVDDEIDALHVLGQVIGGVRLGALVHTQVREADDDVGALLLERGDLLGRAGIELFAVLAGEELQALNELGVGLGLGLRRLETEEANLHAALFDDGVGVKDGLAVGAEHIGAQNFELGGLHVLRQLGIAVVELVVADGGHVVAGGVHHGHRVGALVDADVDGALAVVAGVGQNDLGALRLIVGLQRCHGRVQVDRTMHVVRVQDDGLAIERLCLAGCKRRARQAQDQAQHQQQRKQFLRVLHVISSIISNLGYRCLDYSIPRRELGWTLCKKCVKSRAQFEQIYPAILFQLSNNQGAFHFCHLSFAIPVAVW